MGKNPIKKGKAFTRRDFLKGFGGGAIGAAVAPKILAQESASIETKSGKLPVFTKKQITLDINGEKYTLVVEPQETLLDLLREKLNLTGAKKTCNQGECGGCTVLLDGEPVYSCLYLAIRADGKSIQTIENLADGKELHPIQQAFIDEDAYQCGFCSPGFIMTTAAFLKTNQNPDLKEIKKALSGNICRCGNYDRIYQAVEKAAKQMGRS
jgi:aerobic-type carbon monoxide dehydrogenase small subunit (CoxS/CutS family)